MNILGASLGELLRHGSQFGLGVQAAGRQNAQQQYEVGRQNKEDEQKALLQQALLDQYHASAERDRSYGRQLLEPKPETPVSWQTIQTDDGYVQVNPKTGETRPVSGGGRQLRPKPPKAAGSEPTRGETTADANGYAELWASQMKGASTLPDFDRRAIEDAATKNLLARFPNLGTYEAARMVRRAFRSELDSKVSVGGDDDYAARLRAAATGTAP